MNDDKQLELTGFEEYPTMNTNNLIPDFNQFVTKKIETIKSGGGFDPYELMLQKKKIESGEIKADKPIQTWPKEDIKALEDFCCKYGIVGFNAGKMSPIAALSLLKKKLGIDDVDNFSELSSEYKKIHKFNQSFPYTEMVKKKTLLKG